MKSKKTGSKRALRAVETTDLKAARAAARWRDHPPVRAGGTLSELADQPQLYAICWVTMLVGAWRKDGRLARTGLRMLAAEWLATRAKSIIKHRVDRTRPHVPIDGGGYRLAPGSSRERALSSFPSGHTAGAVAVAHAFSSEYPEHAVPAAIAAGLVGLIQIPRCAHFASDIGAGAAIGLAAGSLAAKRPAALPTRPPSPLAR